MALQIALIVAPVVGPLIAREVTFAVLEALLGRPPTWPERAWITTHPIAEGPLIAKQIRHRKAPGQWTTVNVGIAEAGTWPL
jgi:hypothetical protein